jgi:hypothetical protein
MVRHYLVKALLWSISLKRYVVAGEVLGLSDENAAPLLKAGVVELLDVETEER